MDDRTLVDLATGQVLGIVDGRDSRAVGDWLAQRSEQWRERIEIVAIDPSAAFRKALRTWLPRAAVSVDKFHLVKLGNDMVTTVRQRLAHTHRGRRGRKDDPAWAHRMLLLRGGDTLTPRAWERLERVFRTDDPTDELSASWGIKEQLRRLLATDTLAQAWQERMRMGYFVQIANMPEATKLYDTVVTSWGRHRGPHRHRRNHREGRSGQHRHQEHQTHRPRIPQRGELPDAYPAHQRRENRSVNTRHSRVIHHEPRRAS